MGSLTRAGIARATSRTSFALWPGAGNVLVLMLAMIAAIAILGTAVGYTGDTFGHGSSTSTPQSRASADIALAAQATRINRASVGETRVAKFLGTAFGISEDAITTERNQLGASWGDLTIAHTLAASDKEGMTAAQLLQLHDRGMGWGQVAAGLRFKLGDTVRAVNEASLVARGRARLSRQARVIPGSYPSFGSEATP
jgi:hypothetical protein